MNRGFLQWAERERSSLIRLAAKATGGRERSFSADDLLHEALFRAARTARGTSPAEYRAYFVKALYSVLANELRRLRPHSFSEEDEPCAAPTNWEADIDQKAQIQHVWALLEDGHRTALYAHVVGVTVAEGAALFGLCLNTYKSRVHRAKEAARRIYLENLN